MCIFSNTFLLLCLFRALDDPRLWMTPGLWMTRVAARRVGWGGAGGGGGAGGASTIQKN